MARPTTVVGGVLLVLCVVVGLLFSRGFDSYVLSKSTNQSTWRGIDISDVHKHVKGHLTAKYEMFEPDDQSAMISRTDFEFTLPVKDPSHPQTGYGKMDKLPFEGLTETSLMRLAPPTLCFKDTVVRRTSSVHQGNSLLLLDGSVVAKQRQMLEGKIQMNVRWANEDPNPKSQMQVGSETISVTYHSAVSGTFAISFGCHSSTLSTQRSHLVDYSANQLL